MGLFRSGRSAELEPPLLQLLIILDEFFKSHRAGDVVNDKHIARLGHRIDLRMWPEFKSRLLGMGLIRAVDRGGLVLSRDLNEVSLWDVYQAMPWPLPRGFTQDHDGWESEIHGILEQSFTDRRATLDMDLEKLFRGESI